MSAKIEIEKDGVWVELELSGSDGIRYNARINKIGETSNRQIGSTNTFTLPPTASNIHALGINVYNQYDLAKALNRKYNANYYVDSVLVQTGFLLINNTRNGGINVNFIDESLDVISKWGSITYKELLEDESLPIASDYADSITELSNYSMTYDGILAPLTNIGGRGYNLCIFPNNLNAIGDKFQVNGNDIRVGDSFNPYQSRPIYNAMSLFDLACERFGFTGVFDESVDWETIKNTYFISDGTDKNDEPSGDFLTVSHGSVASYDFYADFRPTVNGIPYGTNRTSRCIFKVPASTGFIPAAWPNWKDSNYIYDTDSSFTYKPVYYWRTEPTVYKPNLTYGTGGEIRFMADHQYNTSTQPVQGSTTKVVIYWNPSTPGADVISQSYGNGYHFPSTADTPFPSTISVEPDGSGEFDLDITIDKSIFLDVPAGASSVIGVSVTREVYLTNLDTLTLTNMRVTEISNNSSSVTFDKYDQFENNPVDFRYAAPRETLRSLMVAVMHKEGILMNINNNNKTIKFFTYAHYETQQEDGEFQVWDSYHLGNNNPEWRTNYGNNYGKTTKISLAEPFKGNVFNFSLENQGELSRYKSVGLDTNTKFKDVEAVNYVNNSAGLEYTEYTSKGLGLVEVRGVLTGSLNQYSVDPNGDDKIQGSFSNLPMIANVNYGSIPDGVAEWYQLVDKAVRIKDQFLLPVEEIRKLDLSKPVYIGNLGGFYIIEEVSEYRGPSSPVTVNLIKLISELGEATVDPPPTISLTSVAYQANEDILNNRWTISNTITFNDYIPTIATIYAYLDSDPNVSVFSQVLTVGSGFLPPYSNVNVTWTQEAPLGSFEGTYRIKVVDNQDPDNKFSNVEYVTWTDDDDARIIVTVNGNGTAEGFMNITYNYHNFVSPPTTSVIKYTPWNTGINAPLGPEVTEPWPITPTIDTVLFDFGAPGDYKVSIVSTEATWTSEDQPNGVVFVE